jgi:hypothetical protein
MSQVEGGDLMVIQRGQESTLKGSGQSGSSSEKGGATGAAARFLGGVVGAVGQSDAGWRDGPWWRATEPPRSLGTVDGLVEGTKLCRANAEGYAADFFAANGGVEAAKQRAIEPLSDSNPVRSSDIFLAVQAIRVRPEASFFAGTTAEEKGKKAEDKTDASEPEICFAVYLLDPVHEIRYSALSQRVPARWIKWLDAPVKNKDDDSSSSSSSSDDEDDDDDDSSSSSSSSSDETSSVDAQFRAEFGHVPPEIRDIVESGGVDPREWVAEWVEEALALAVGIVAQRYVARRMGVGEGAIGKGKKKVENVLAEGGNEAARAGI